MIRWLQCSTTQINYIKMPITTLDPIIEFEECNKVLEFLEQECEKGTFLHTKSGGISKTIRNIQSNKFEVRKLQANGVIEALVYHNDYGWARIQFRNCKTMKNGEKEEAKVYGSQALRALLKHVPELDKDISLDEELNRRKQEEARCFYHVDRYPNIGFEGIPVDAQYTIGRELRGCVCSLDIHSAFPAALVRVRPATKKYIEDLYEKRKVKPENKQILNLAIGAMTMDATTFLGCGAKKALSPLRYEVLRDHSKLLHKLINLLKAQRATIINLRTDSIKFIWFGEKPPILPYKGDGLGQWSYEFYKADRYRQYSTGCYQYEVDGEHKVVYSGLTKYEVNVKPREQWTWDDLEYVRNHANEIVKWRYDAETNRIVLG